MRVKLVLEKGLANDLRKRKALIDLPPLSLVETSEKLSGAWFLVPEKAKLVGYVSVLDCSFSSLGVSSLAECRVLTLMF